MTNNCNECIHSQVCKISDDYNHVFNTIEKLNVPDTFNIIIQCKHRKQEKDWSKI